MRSEPRILVLAADAMLGQRIAETVTGPGRAIDVGSPTVAEPPTPAPTLCIAELTGDAELPRAACPIIAVQPSADLAAALALLERDERVVAVLAAEPFDAARLGALTTSIVADDPFGLAGQLASGTQIQRTTVKSYRDKTTCMGNVRAFVAACGAPERTQIAIEQCLDETLMNALYDAPIGASGEHIFASVRPRHRVKMRTQYGVTVEYGFDGKRIGIAVRDVFGSLTRKTVLRVLHKGLHASQKVDTKLGGAGLGLYLIACAATGLSFRILPQAATEVACTFELESTSGLAALEILEQRERRDHRPTPPAKRIRVYGARDFAAIAASVAVVAAGVLVALWPRLFGEDQAATLRVTTVPAGATVFVDGTRATTAAGSTVVGPLRIDRHCSVSAHLDGYEPARARLELHGGENEVTLELQQPAKLVLASDPTGAHVELDGRPAGTTPITVTTAPPGARVTAVFKLPGHDVATASLEAPARGGALQHVQPLQRDERFVRVRFWSTPSGAAVVRTGESPDRDRIFTPAEIFVEVGQEQRFTLVMAKHQPFAIPPFTPVRGTEPVEKGGELRAH